MTFWLIFPSTSPPYLPSDGSVVVPPRLCVLPSGVIKHGNGKSPTNGDFDRKSTHKWSIFHCHVWLPEGTLNKAHELVRYTINPTVLEVINHHHIQQFEPINTTWHFSGKVPSTSTSRGWTVEVMTRWVLCIAGVLKWLPDFPRSPTTASRWAIRWHENRGLNPRIPHFLGWFILVSGIYIMGLWWYNGI